MYCMLMCWKITNENKSVTTVNRNLRHEEYLSAKIYRSPSFLFCKVCTLAAGLLQCHHAAWSPGHDRPGYKQQQGKRGVRQLPCRAWNNSSKLWAAAGNWQPATLLENQCSLEKQSNNTLLTRVSSGSHSEVFHPSVHEIKSRKIYSGHWTTVLVLNSLAEFTNSAFPVPYSPTDEVCQGTPLAWHPDSCIQDREESWTLMFKKTNQRVIW